MSLTLILPIFLIAAILWWMAHYLSALRTERLEKQAEFNHSPAESKADVNTAFSRPRRLQWSYLTPIRYHAASRLDALVLAIILLVYGCAAFFQLGDTEAPQSFRTFEAAEDPVVISFEEPTSIASIRYYTGLWPGNYSVTFSNDGVNYWDETVLPQSYADLFKWLDRDLEATAEAVSYVRIAADTKMQLGEIAFFDDTGSLISASSAVYDDADSTLFDEQALIPDEPSRLNSAYFDEIYHARTAYEHLTNVYPYEISHPPLGKLLIAAGISIFGMTPFGWRFTGTLFGVLMLIPLYLLIRSLFGKTSVAACGTLIFAFDFMHYTQTRIATIDTYAVFFILFAYFFMYRFLTTDPEESPAKRRLSNLWLALSGLSFGFGAASKWTVIYAGAGLALLWLIYWILRFVRLRREKRVRAGIYPFACNVFLCLVFFVLIPVLIYYVSYYPYGKASGMSGPLMLLTDKYAKIVGDNQVFMYTYHSRLEATHPYSSTWLQWIFDIRPILYYRSYSADGTIRSAIAAFTNPLVCWAGLGVMLTLIYLAFARRDLKALFIVIGYFSQLGPWLAVTRLTFAYHYFPSMIFIVLGISYAFDKLQTHLPQKRWTVYGFTGAAVALFLIFYPVISGFPVSMDYASSILRWLPNSWPF